MSIMVAEIYKALIEAGASEASARAAASAIPIAKDLATKQDITDTKQDIAELKQDIVVLKFAVFTFGPVILALLIKLVFFP